MIITEILVKFGNIKKHPFFTQVQSLEYYIVFKLELNNLKVN